MALSSDIVILFFLFLLSGFFSSAEAALLSLTDLHLHKMKSDHYPFFDCVMKLLENPRRLLITIVTGNEVVNISISILAAALFISLFGPRHHSTTTIAEIASIAPRDWLPMAEIAVSTMAISRPRLIHQCGVVRRR